ncbi:Glycosyl transferases group 1 [Carpediemonas membranifera]|uniref:Glycosyl transferases group 1 n=1 Tax=Carpediemonas membranifera TaxID=201153 RepID=A0A8J6E3X4_9EUKA|nr:Glycosyl transferases group 1 [Carpediemonas membranifera]|eukprot:KAG9393742.1 Glycosyl transferases group 1 [Carpediemonas membranifera]
MIERLKSSAKGSVAVVVLGDVGRSPRMQYHALSLAEHGFHVSLVGLAGSSLIQALNPHIESNSVSVYRYKLPYSRSVGRLSYLFMLPVKMLLQAMFLVMTLFMTISKPTHVLVQTPPAIPVLPVAWLAARWHGAKFIVDWHNLGFTLLGLRFGTKHPLVRVYGWLERLFGRRANRCFTVSQQMTNWMLANFNIPGAVVLHDKPAPQFFPRSPAVSHTLFHRLNLVPGAHPPPDLPYISLTKETLEGPTLFTACGTDVKRLPDRPLLVVSGTSWTPDEDVDALIDGLAALDSQLDTDTLKVVCIITGMGPMREAGMAKIASLKLRSARIYSAWLTAEDYPALIGSADVGVSLHTSSSGVDLPMKILDMFGSGVPAISVHFKTITELVSKSTGIVLEPGINVADQLCETLAKMVADGRQPDSTLAKLRARVIAKYGDQTTMEGADRWRGNWAKVALPVFLDETKEKDE